MLSLVNFVIMAAADKACKEGVRGGAPLGTSEVELIQVFTHVMGASGGINHALGAGPVVTSCYMNMEKRFAFVEFRSIEEATNALALDGVQFRGEQLKVCAVGHESIL